MFKGINSIPPEYAIHQIFYRDTRGDAVIITQKLEYEGHCPESSRLVSLALSEDRLKEVVFAWYTLGK